MNRAQLDWTDKLDHHGMLPVDFAPPHVPADVIDEVEVRVGEATYHVTPTAVQQLARSLRRAVMQPPASERQAVDLELDWDAVERSPRRRVSSGTCAIDGCDKPSSARSWCWMHYSRWQRHGDPLIVNTRGHREQRLCSVNGCSNPHNARGYCRTHYARWQRNGTPHVLVQPWMARS